jgi:lipopolysaccharide biosynthesis glycosyltransferase
VNKINVVCVYKDQSNDHKPWVNYSEDYVDRLYRGVKRNIKIEFEFYCLSNRETKYNTIPLITNSDGYWNKIELFRPNLFNGPTLYLDLDVVVCGDLTDLVNQITPDKLLMVEEPYRSIHNSSVMLWNNDYSDLYHRYVDNQEAIVKEHTDFNRNGALGDQSYISETIEHDIVDHKYIGWRHHKIDTKINDPSLLIFTGKKKPHLETELDIVKENWI